MTSGAGRRLAIIGAGPIGLAGALLGLERGWDVQVFETGIPGDALRRWGPTRCFTPMSMNLPAVAFEILGRAAPPVDALLTGPEMADEALVPLAASQPLAGRVHVGARVVAIGRRGMRRGDFAAHPIRAERPFRLLVASQKGEQTHEADRVLDASGGYRLPNAAGWGGIPAMGERSHSSSFIRDLGSLNLALPELAGRRVLLLGHGHSAATAIAWLTNLARTNSSTSLTWAVRTLARHPVLDVPDDPLPERRRTVQVANRLAELPPSQLSVRRRVGMISIELAEDGYRAGFSDGSAIVVDRVVSLTGYRPDASFITELAVESSPTTEGGARLARALASITDCLSVPSIASKELASGEPGFYFAGSRAYGRAPTFLLQTGLAQLEPIFGRLENGE